MEAINAVCCLFFSIEESCSDPQIVHRNSVFEMNHSSGGKIKFRGFPAFFSESITKKDTPPPVLGMHTSEILHDLGYTEEEIAKWTKENIVK